MSVVSLMKAVYRELVSKPQSKPQEDTVKLTPEEEKIWNEGERLIPGITHDDAEPIRVKSLYEFFRMIITQDMENSNGRSKKPSKVVDLGCGIGYGCITLSEIKNAIVTGIDCSQESVSYGEKHFSRKNIEYKVANLSKYVFKMPVFDYVVSRGVLEHIANGLCLAAVTKYTQRLIFDVPYKEGEGNKFHLIRGVDEDSFAHMSDPELFYQDLDGVIYDVKHKPPKANMIICACRGNKKLPKIKDMGLKFPIPAPKPDNQDENKMA